MGADQASHRCERTFAIHRSPSGLAQHRQMATSDHQAKPERSVGAAANTRSASTTWAWRRVKISQPAAGHGHSAGGAGSTRALPPWPRRRNLTVVIRHRGGAESWWEIKARGRVWRLPGHLCLEDAFAQVLGETGRPPSS